MIELRRRTGRRSIVGLYLAIVVAIAVLRSSGNTTPSILLCNAWVSTASLSSSSSSSTSSSSSGSTSTSTFSSLASSKYSPSIRSTDTDRRYWMILNAVVDNKKQQENGTSTSSSSRSQNSKIKTSITTTTNSKIKIKNTNKIYIVDRWNSMFQRLKDYKTTHGNTNVPKKYKDDNDDDNNNNNDNDTRKNKNSPSLGNWVSKQRFEALVYQNTNGDEGQITPDRISKLESIGFVWELGRQDEWEEKWLSMYSELEDFHQKYHSSKVPILNNKEQQQFDNNGDGSSNMDDPLSCLGRWVKTQRIQRNKLMRDDPAPAMTKERLQLLQKLDFAWSGKRVTDYDKWLNMYFKLLFYHQRHNTTIVSDADGQGSSRLLKWTEQQRRYYKKIYKKNGNLGLNLDNGNTINTDALTQHRVDLLNEIDFDWLHCHDDRTWEDMYNELVEYKENFNSTLISTTINEHLGKWTITQRIKYNSRDTIALDRKKIQMLNDIDFDWNATGDVNWNAMMDRLDAYKRKHDTTIVPNHDGGDRPLANWVNNQRVKLGKYVLNENGEFYYYPDDHYNDLVERIAFDLGCSPETEFEPKGFIQKLSPFTKATRIKRLNGIGFVWDAQEASWQGMYQRLLVYKDQNDGCTMVPFTSTMASENNNKNSNNNNNNECESLGVWVKVQRLKKQLDEISNKRMTLLNEIDFVWDPQEAQWADMFERLCLYQTQNDGSTQVPRSNPELGVWLNTQRRAYKRKTLLEERIERLDSIGFVWEIL